MSASASIEAGVIPLGRFSVPVGVFRFQEGQFELLTNIRVQTIQSRQGADPGVARFRYVFDATNPPNAPKSFEQALAVDSDLSGVVQNDERLVVMTSYQDGSPLILFDGFAQVPELHLAPSQEHVIFSAYGIAVREWDTPIAGALMRDSSSPETGSDVETDLVAYFNPQGQPNATPPGADAKDQFDNGFPTFLDALVIRDPDMRSMWTLSRAIRYLCYHENPEQKYVKNPAGAEIDALLDSRAPKDGVTLQQSDSTTVASQAIEVPNYPATGKAWPNVVEDLLRPNGFGMAFRLETDDAGLPFTTLDLFRRQDGSPAVAKDLFLQLSGNLLDPAQTNMNAARLARDMSGVANAYTVESELVRYEATFILAPAFAIAASDALTTANLAAFDLSNPAFTSTNHDRYRLYIFDETGEGHWDWATSNLVSSIPSLAKLLGGDPADSVPHAIRRRVPLGELFTRDPNQKALKARLSISTDYTGKQPSIWDGSGTWQPVHGGFSLLRDRLGIWIHVANPNGWAIGTSSAFRAPYPAGVVRGVEDQATTGRHQFALRLTCVIEGDQVLSASATRRPSSPTTFQVLRRVDARDRYFKHLIAPLSEFNSSSAFVTVRDDSQEAQAEADAHRLANEAGEVAGSVTIPRFTNAYRVGDRIRAIQGRGLSLRTNVGAPAEEGEVFPAVVGVTWDFVGKQQTILHLSDERGIRP